MAKNPLSKSIRSSPSYLQITATGYYFRFSIPLDVRSKFKKAELKCSLRTGKLSETKYKSRPMVSIAKLTVNNIRKGGRMAELTPDQINNLIKKYFKKCLDDDEDWRVNRKPLNDIELESRLNAKALLKYEFQEDLTKSNYHSVSFAVEGLLADNGLAVNRESESFKKLCREMLKVNIKLSEVAIQSELDNYDSDFTSGLPAVFSSGQLQALPQNNLPTEILSKVIMHYSSEAKVNWTEKTKAEIVDGTLGLLMDVLGDTPIQSIDRRKINEF